MTCMMMEDTPCSNLTFCLCITKIEKDGTVSVENHFMDLTFTAQFGNLANSSMDLPLPASTSQYLVSSSRTLSNTGPCLTAYTIDILGYHIQEQAPKSRQNTKKNKITHMNKCAKTQTCPASMANFSVLSKNRASSVSRVASR